MKPISATVSLLSAAGALTLMTALVATDATAQGVDGGQHFSFGFNYTQDELATSDGVKAVYGRLEAALRKSCREAGHFSPIDGYYVEQCVSQNLGNAVKQIGNPVLAELAAERARS